jgi:hypothetical protein
VIGDTSCCVMPASSGTTLALRGFPSGMRHAAIVALVGYALRDTGLKVSPTFVFSGPSSGGSDLRSMAHGVTTVTTAAGDALLRCASLTDALTALSALRGFRIGRRVGNSGVRGLWAGGRVEASLATAAEIRRAALGEGTTLEKHAGGEASGSFTDSDEDD